MRKTIHRAQQLAISDTLAFSNAHLNHVSIPHTHTHHYLRVRNNDSKRFWFFLKRNYSTK